jgi:hypothetical protein
MSARIKARRRTPKSNPPPLSKEARDGWTRWLVRSNKLNGLPPRHGLEQFLGKIAKANAASRKRAAEEDAAGRKRVMSDAKMCKEVKALADKWERILGSPDPDKAKKVRKIIASMRAWRRDIRALEHGRKGGAA